MALIRQVSESCSSSAAVSAKRIAETAEQGCQESALPLAGDKSATTVAEMVSSAVQTDSPQSSHQAPQNSTAVNQVDQTPQGVQGVHQVAAHQQAEVAGGSQQPQATAAPYIIQSPHFHIYPQHPPAPAPLLAAPQQPAQAAPVINISQPTFHLHPPMLPCSNTQADHTLPAADAVQPAAELGTMQQSAPESETVLQGAPEFKSHQQPAAVSDIQARQASAELKAVYTAADPESMLLPATSADESHGFDSWCPVTAKPHPSISMSTAPDGGEHSLPVSNQPSGMLHEEPLAGQQRQVCRGAHAALPRHAQPCCHHQVGLLTHVRLMQRLRAVTHCGLQFRADLLASCP